MDKLRLPVDSFVKTLSINPIIYQYLLAISVRETPILAKIRLYTQTLPSHGMQISPEQGQFMGLLIEMIGAKKIIEIGVYTGYSSLVMAQALPDNGRLIACEVDAVITKIAQKYWVEAGVDHKIQLRIGPGLKTLENLCVKDSNSFDLIFIDADKKNYFAYYEKSLTLLRTGGLILLDNTLWKGRLVDEQTVDPICRALREFNEFLWHDERISLSVLPIGDGLTIARKR